MMTYILIIENEINEQGDNIKHSVHELSKDFFGDVLFVLLSNYGFVFRFLFKFIKQMLLPRIA